MTVTGRAILVVMIAASPIDAGWALAHKHHAATAPSTRDADTSATATIAAKPPAQKPPPSATAEDDETLPSPFHLPTASRKRMRDCGLRWQAMKASGEAGEQIWRDFATLCLAAASDPLDRRSER